jgi:putative hemolysin
MSVALALLTLGVLVLLSAIYSGSETGFYCVSRIRIDADAENGHRPSYWIRRLLKDETGLLITILIGNNLAIELVTLLGEHYLASMEVIAEAWLDVAVTLILTPVLFFFAELLPKDLFRRRPYALLSWTVWPIAFFYVLFWPLMVVLRLFTRGVQKLFGVQEEVLMLSLGREELLEMLEESSRSGTLEIRTETLARNALSLTNITVGEVMIPWQVVESLNLRGGKATKEAQDSLVRAVHSRLPVVSEGTVIGYVHQLDMLSKPKSERRDLGPMLHEIDCFGPEVSVQAALGSLRRGGRRAALVGAPDAPVGLITLKDLAERISGDLAGW